MKQKDIVFDDLFSYPHLLKYIIQKYFVLLTVLRASHYDISIRSTSHKSKYRAAWQMKDNNLIYVSYQTTLLITPTKCTICFIEDVPLCLNLQGKQIVNSCRQTQQ